MGILHQGFHPHQRKEIAAMERRQVLLVTNAITSDEIIEVKKALVNAPVNHMNIKLSLVHVIPQLPTCYFNIPSMLHLVEKYYEEAKQYLTQAGERLGVSKQDQWLLAGKVKVEVLRLAKKTHAHFILASSQYIQELQKSDFRREEYKFINTMSAFNSLKRV